MIFDWLGEVLPEVTQAGRLGSRKVTNFRQCPVIGMATLTTSRGSPTVYSVTFAAFPLFSFVRVFLAAMFASRVIPVVGSIASIAYPYHSTGHSELFPL